MSKASLIAGRILIGAMVIILVVLIIVSINSCSQSPNNQNDYQRVKDSSVEIYRFVDKEAGVVCWTYRVYDTLSCLPIKDTLLSK